MRMDAGVPLDPQAAQIAPAVSSYSAAGSVAYTPRLNWNERCARRHDVSITLVTRDNYFLFTPMLHEVAASDLEMNTIVNPLRKMLSASEDLHREYRNHKSRTTMCRGHPWLRSATFTSFHTTI